MNEYIFPGLVDHVQGLAIKKMIPKSESDIIRFYLEDMLGSPILTKQRNEEIVFYKHLWRYFIYWHTKASLQRTAGLTGCLHASVINSLKQVVNYYNSSSGYKNLFIRIEKHVIENVGKERDKPIIKDRIWNECNVRGCKHIMNNKEIIKFR